MGLTNRSKVSLKTISTAISLLVLCGCSCLPKQPDIRPKQILVRLGKCKQYTMDFGDKMTFKFEKDIPLDQCLADGYFVISDTELKDLRNYYNEAKKCYEKECKGR